MEKKISELLKELEKDETFIADEAARKAFVFSLILMMIEA
ncbi:hypothetical protein OXPF_31700 [Oxobacter pfennigii]|uniref:Uncharacterized protein n=1 Tax=Oxobacter pfennigii TaxID=36849 RepID=A0A0P8W3J3_9CLOT|nr:hypothetical protein OXPF_31700 [Oxobacter pfennigii]